MIGLCITVVIVIGFVCSIGIYAYAEFKEKELEYKKEQDKHITQLTDIGTQLDIEREHTKQMELDKDAFKEREKTRQYEIKLEYREKHGSSLY